MLDTSTSDAYSFAGYHHLNDGVLAGRLATRKSTHRTGTWHAERDLFLPQVDAKSTSEDGYLLLALLNEQNYWMGAEGGVDGGGIAGMRRWLRSDAIGLHARYKHWRCNLRRLPRRSDKRSIPAFLRQENK